MIFPEPEIILDDSLSAIREIQGELAGRLSPREREGLLFDLSVHHRLAAIGALLSTADVEAWRRELTASAAARRDLLAIPAKVGRAPGPFQRASAVAPFHDALAAGETALAVAIARASPAAWMEDDEFEDDFCHARFLYAFVAEGPGSPEITATVSRWAQCAPDRAARLSLARSLAARDSDGFEAALQDLLAERDEEVAELEKEIVVDPLRHAAEKHVFVEGIALLHLAHAAGLPTGPEYPAMPGLARRDL